MAAALYVLPRSHGGHCFADRRAGTETLKLECKRRGRTGGGGRGGNGAGIPLEHANEVSKTAATGGCRIVPPRRCGLRIGTAPCDERLIAAEN